MHSPGAGASPSAARCAECGRRIGSHLSYPDPEDARMGSPLQRKICYRCHRLASRGRLPFLLDDVGQTPSARSAQFLMYRLGMVLIAGCTYVFVRQSGEFSFLLYGLGGVILFYTLSVRVRPRRASRDPKPDRPPRGETDDEARRPPAR